LRQRRRRRRTATTAAKASKASAREKTLNIKTVILSKSAHIKLPVLIALCPFAPAFDATQIKQQSI
jgi:hypothetical protein